MQSDLKITDLFIYPIKSCSANPLTQAEVRPRGLADDRRWVIVDASGKTLTARDHAVISLIQVSVEGNGLQLSHTGKASIEVGRPAADGKRQDITVWSDSVSAADAGDRAADWLSELIGQDARLCYMDDHATRVVVDSEATVSFADTYPLLLAGTASVRDLSERAQQELPMLRFRPNVVAETDTPYVEDTWERIVIGNVEFDVSGPCERCKFTTLDPITADVHPQQEPLRTLATYRRNASGAVCFGQYLVPVTPGQINVGDTLRVIR